ncbi:MAG: methyltransferase domain-containing protein [Bryobacteraceae bacterium]
MQFSSIRRAVSALGLTIVLAAAAPAWEQVHPLTGRKIASVMGVGGADWLERSDRESEEAPAAAIKALRIQPGMTAADIGAGTGYFTVRLARGVGPAGKVYAVDIQPEMLTLLRRRARAEKLTNIQTVLGAVDNPHLPAATMDLILLVDVYHEFSEPEKMLDELRAALKPDGRLVLLEYRKEDPSIPIRPEHKMSVAEAKTEVEAEGFRLDKVIETLPRQHILIFRK